MLADSPMTTILPVVDLPRARAFYERKLGLRPEGLKPDGKFVYRLGGGGLLALFQRANATQADHTAVSFEVKDVATAVRLLQDKGVVFNDYDFPGLKTVQHMCVLGSEKAAWFNDSEGNILCIHENLR
jgi:catechol 2,3-dioxygenase-like lactoylglutathione lyase family enzyme